MMIQRPTKLLYSDDSELAMLGCLIQDPARIDDVRYIVSPAHFTGNDTRALYTLLLMLYDAKVPLNDQSVLVQEVSRAELPELDHRKKVDLIRDCATAAGIPSNASYHASRIRERAQYRAILARIERARQQAESQSDTPEAISLYLSQITLALEATAGEDIVRVGDDVDAVIEQITSSESKRAGIATGISVFDQSFGLMRPGEVSVIAARAGVGKSKLAESIITHNAKLDRPGLIVSLEMHRHQFVQRMLCTNAQVDSRRIRSGNLTQTHETQLARAADELRSLPAYTWSPLKAVTIDEIISRCRAFRVKHGLQIIALDYLQLVDSDKHGRSLYEKVSYVSRRVKQMALELDAVVLLLSQLNRETDKQDRPHMGNLRDSSSIESDADQVILLHRQRDACGILASEMQLIVGKSRESCTGSVTVDFDPITGFQPSRITAFDAFNDETVEVF